MKKYVESINDFANKYQSLLTIAGILIGFLFTGWQIHLNREEINISQTQIKKETLPKWNISIELINGDPLLDKMVFTTNDPAINLIKTKVSVYNLATPYTIEEFGSDFQTNRLKNLLATIALDYHDFKSNKYHTGFSSTDKDRYPIAITFYYESYGVRKDTTALVDYIFSLYYKHGTDEAIVRSHGLEFQKYISSQPQTLQKELIRRNLDSGIMACCPDMIYIIKDEILSRDNFLNPLLQLAELYTKGRIRTYKIDNDPYLKSSYDLALAEPEYFYNARTRSVKDSLIKVIDKNIQNNIYDKNIIDAYNNIIGIDQCFKKYEGGCIDYIRTKFKPRINTTMNQGEYEQLMSAKSELFLAVYNKVDL